MMKKIINIVTISLLFAFILTACGADKRESGASAEESMAVGTGTEQAQEAEETKIVQEEKNVFEEITPLVQEVYDYDIEEKIFSFYTDEAVYNIPYVRINGCPNEQLQWKINHTLWEEACWIFDCAELENDVYSLYQGESATHITGIYQCGRFLSVVYELGWINNLPGNIVYGIVVDTLSGERILLADVIKDKEAFKELLVHYFDDDQREIRLFIRKEDAEDILFLGGMTEGESVIYNITFAGKYPEEENGDVGSVSWLFDAASFYMTEDSFVVLPGAHYYEPLIFEREIVSDVLVEEAVVPITSSAGKDENAFFYTTDAQHLTANVEYDELETRTEKEIGAEVYLVKEYEQGKVYKFAIEPIGYLGEERTNIYFYVTSDKIYRLYSYIYQNGETIEFYDNDELLVQYLDTDEKLIKNGTIVCQPEGTTELKDKESIYSITVNGNRVTYSRSDEKVNGERGFCERFVWEEGKGLVEYSSGFGVEEDILYLSQIEAVASTKVGIYRYDISSANLEEIIYTQVCGMEDKELENKINESLAYVFTQVIATDLDKISYFSDMPIIMFQNDEYLSVKTIIYYTNPNIGGGRLIAFPIYQTVSIRTGELLELDDFVEVSDEFVQYLLDSPEAIRSIKDDDIDEVWNETLDVRIRAYIKEEISAEEMLQYFEEANTDYDTENYSNKCAFYLTEGEINIVHATNVVDLPKYFKIRLEVDDIEEYLKVPKWRK